ncbi:hypothetical protein H4218_001407 [Coemansia sp. IMI 209128]|uniref:Uncharacterized protein n=2 Tax=Coemansia TaxID=4863 RepID=A0A9W8GM92_9FUNG|nr:hypothetical protein GGI10_001156 [Coemansia sp. RSA 2530]KAJ2688850.1 hypothetical protein IWW39_001899 [Coemansia spiralis]KAJ2701440.1 hypothetical protein H4218_001407 [Coemansia sp. IMI 209128]
MERLGKHWLRDFINYLEATGLWIHHGLRLPGIFIVTVLSICEWVYCVLHQLLDSDVCAETQINKHIREHCLHNEHAKGPNKPKRVAIVTGANGGLGYETAMAIGRAGYTTILACRDLKRGQQALYQLEKETGLHDTFKLIELDLASFLSIDRFVTEFKEQHQQLHLLVCNAGMAFNHYDTTYDGLESQFGTNFVGHYMLIDRLLDTMKKSGSARITIASSIAACMVRSIDYTRVTDVWRFNRLINYSTSKLALLVYSHALARKLQGSGVTVNAFHPGLVITGLYRNISFLSLPGIHDLTHWMWLKQRAGSVTSVYLALSPDLEGKTGGYYARELPAAIHPDALKVEVQDRLCKFTDVLIATNTHAPNVLDSINVSSTPA